MATTAKERTVIVQQEVRTVFIETGTSSAARTVFATED
jgi:hypothetical protein